MKKIITLSIIALLSFQLTSCKKEEKKEEKKEKTTETTKTETQTKVEEKSTARYSLKNADNTINFTAFKTTEKIPVKGVFTKVELTNGCEGNTIKDAINGAEFKVPVSSIETKDASRNFKIQKFFFQVMENTMDLTGKLKLTDDKNGVAEFTMNGVTKELPFKYTIIDQTFSMKTIMNIDNWNTQKALTSLNEACKDLHKGADGVSKTWNEVAIYVTSTFK